MNAATGFSLPLKVAFVHHTFGILCWYMHWYAKGISVLVIAGGGVALVRSFVCFPLLFFFFFLVARRTIFISWGLFVRFLAFGYLREPPMSGSTRTQSSINVRRLHARIAGSGAWSDRICARLSATRARGTRKLEESRKELRGEGLGEFVSRAEISRTAAPDR